MPAASVRALRKRIAKTLRKYEQDSPAFANPPRGREARGVHWLEPALVCEVEFTEWTSDGQLRHPSFKGLRDDKAPEKIVRETPESLNDKLLKASNSRGAGAKSAKGEGVVTVPRISEKKSAGAQVSGVNVSNPDKELYPEGITKLEVVEYFDRVAPHILPYVINRPLTLVRCPNGREEKCFYQKHLTESMPEHVYGVPIKEKDGTEDYLVIREKEGLLELANLGVLEFHIWGAKTDDVERPDILVFDLDPDTGLDRAVLVEAVKELHQRLDDLGLRSFLKASGGKGFHVVVPIRRKHDWEGVKAFTKAIALQMVKDYPKRYTAVMTKAKRRGKIYIDFLRNSRGATFIAPYSTRARANAPVSVPLDWKELSADTDPAGWTIRTIVARLRKKKDPWSDFYNVKQSLTDAMIKRLL